MLGLPPVSLVPQQLRVGATLSLRPGEHVAFYSEAPTKYDHPPGAPVCAVCLLEVPPMPGPASSQWGSHEILRAIAAVQYQRHWEGWAYVHLDDDLRRLVAGGLANIAAFKAGQWHYIAILPPLESEVTP